MFIKHLLCKSLDESFYYKIQVSVKLERVIRYKSAYTISDTDNSIDEKGKLKSTQYTVNVQKENLK